MRKEVKKVHIISVAMGSQNVFYSILVQEHRIENTLGNS